MTFSGVNVGTISKLNVTKAGNITVSLTKTDDRTLTITVTNAGTAEVGATTLVYRALHVNTPL